MMQAFLMESSAHVVRYSPGLAAISVATDPYGDARIGSRETPQLAVGAAAR